MTQTALTLGAAKIIQRVMLRLYPTRNVVICKPRFAGDRYTVKAK